MTFADALAAIGALTLTWWAVRGAAYLAVLTETRR